MNKKSFSPFSFRYAISIIVCKSQGIGTCILVQIDSNISIKFFDIKILAYRK